MRYLQGDWKTMDVLILCLSISLLSLLVDIHGIFTLKVPEGDVGFYHISVYLPVNTEQNTVPVETVNVFKELNDLMVF